MKSQRLPSLLAPLAYLYLLAQVGAQSVAFDGVSKTLAVAGLLLAFMPMVLRPRSQQRGQRRVRALSLMSAFAMFAVIGPGSFTWAAELAWAWLLPAIAALCIDLAADVPEPPRRLSVSRHRFIAIVGAGVLAFVGSVVMMPTEQWFGDALLWPSSYRSACILGCTALIGFAVVTRARRRQFDSSPSARAANAWALLGMVPAMIALLVHGIEHRAQIQLGSQETNASRLAFGAALVCVSLGHVWLLDERRRVSADRTLRSLLATFSAVALVAAADVLVLTRVEHSLTALLALVAGSAVAVGLLRDLLTRPIRWLLAPAHGALLDALSQISTDVERMVHMRDLAREVLGGLNRASAAHESRAVLFTFNPDRSFEADAAGEPHATDRKLSAAIVKWWAERPAEPILIDLVAPRVVRHPEERPLFEALESLDALCVLPLRVEGELEGVLIVPRGARRDRVSLEELGALDAFAERLAARLALFAQNERAHLRAQQAERGLLSLAARTEALSERLQDEAHRDEPRSASAHELVAYSASMRALKDAIAKAAAHDVPVLIAGEPGTEIEDVALSLVSQSARTAQTCVWLRATQTPAADLEEALLGRVHDDGRRSPGALERAGNGTLIIDEIAAFPADLQNAIAEAISERRALAVGAKSEHVVQARIVLLSRQSVKALNERGLLTPSLASRMSAFSITVPPLRERAEDFESLLLYALARAAKHIGRDALGITPAAQARLRAHAWPGNGGELDWVITHAALRAKTQRIDVPDLPPLVGAKPSRARKSMPPRAQ